MTYWNLRSYGGEPGMIGLEPTFDEHLENLLAVFREVRRVLRKDGTLWLNYGDAYAGGGRGGGSEGSKQRTNVGSLTDPFRPVGFKPKDLMMMPARVAMALQADGWWLRSEIVWAKPNPMPESVTDRPSSAHEKVFLLSKAPRYFYDHFAVRTPPKSSTLARYQHGFNTSRTRWGSDPGYHEANPSDKRKADKQRGHSRRHAGFNDRWDAMSKAEKQAGGAYLRNVWTIATHSFKGAHFATFPPQLLGPCIKAGTSEKGVCAECGAPWRRQATKALAATPKNPTFERHGTKHVDGEDSAASNRHRDGHMPGLVAEYTTTGWEPTCECGGVNLQGIRTPPPTVPAVCLDPFAGAGTVGLVADRLDRDAVLIEINPEYAEIARARIFDDAPLLNSADAG